MQRESQKASTMHFRKTISMLITKPFGWCSSSFLGWSLGVFSLLSQCSWINRTNLATMVANIHRSKHPAPAELLLPHRTLKTRRPEKYCCYCYCFYYILHLHLYLRDAAMCPWCFIVNLFFAFGLCLCNMWSKALALALPILTWRSLTCAFINHQSMYLLLSSFSLAHLSHIFKYMYMGHIGINK